MKSFRNFFKNFIQKKLQTRDQNLSLRGSNFLQNQNNKKFGEKYTKHRNILTLFSLSPEITYSTFIAPNCTIVGEVSIGKNCSIWYGSIIRGDINKVVINKNVHIMENTVIHTAGSIPTGIPSIVEIGSYSIIQSNCTLYSCKIKDNCLVGFNSVILEGSILEEGCSIGPNSVVPPGRIIPANQLWAGNPVEFVRDLKKKEVHFVKNQSQQFEDLLEFHLHEFLLPKSAYLSKTYDPNDEVVKFEEIIDIEGGKEYVEDRRSVNNYPRS